MSLYLESDRRARAARPTRLSARAALTGAQIVKSAGPTVAEAVADFVHWHQNKGSSPKTVTEYLFCLDDRVPKKAAFLPLLAWCKTEGIVYLSDLTKARCQAWLDQMRERSTGKTTGPRAVVMLKRLLAWARDNDLIEALPIKLVEPKRVITEIAVFTPEEMRRIAKFVSKENTRDWAIFSLLLDTGIRSNELISLHMDDLRMDRRELSILGKGNKHRVVPLKDSIPALKAYLRERGDIPGVDWLFLSFMAGASPVWAGGRGKRKRVARKKDLRELFAAAPLTKVGLYQLVRKWGDLANVTEGRNSPHTYRHFFAVSYLRKGGDVFSLQRILGHSNLEMTMRYARLAQIDVRRIHSNASPLSDYISPRTKHAVEIDFE